MDKAATMWSLSDPELTAPEFYMLLYGTQTWTKLEAFKLAVSELVARRELSLKQVEPRGSFGLKERASGLLEANIEPYRHLESRSLQAVLDLVRNAGTRTLPDETTLQITLKGFVRAVRKKYGWAAGYADVEVMPLLADRGLYRREDRKLRLPFGASLKLGAPNWQLTAAGEQKREKLWQNIKLGEEKFGKWVNEDPERALEFLGTVGSGVLFMEGIHQDLHRLNERLREAEDSDVRPAKPDPVETDLSVLEPYLETLQVASVAYAAMGSALAVGGVGAAGGTGAAIE